MNNNHPLVSIIIPVYNAERYVYSTLDSVLNQTWRNLEVIVVNDGSIDRSMEVCQQFDDPRIIYVEQKNSGCASARNAGIRHARGEYLGFIDADDTWMPEKITRHMRQFDQDPDLGLVYSFSSLVDEAGKDLITFQKDGTDPTTFADCYIHNVIGNGSNAILRKEVFTGRDSDSRSYPPMGLFNTELRRAEDFELWSRISGLSQWKIACLPEILVNYRINTAGLSSNPTAQRHFHLLAMAMIAEHVPYDAEKYRTTAVACLYWYLARTLASQKKTLPGLRAARIALHYDWRTFSAGHIIVISALASSAVLPRQAFFSLFRLSGRAWGWWQRLTLRFRRAEKNHTAVAYTAKQSMSAMIGKPESYARKKAMPNLFFLCHKHRLMFLGIAKNASTTLKHIMYREEFGADTQEVPAEIHRFWGWGPHADRAIETHKAKDVEAYSGYTRFAIYRDPVSRFLSAYHNMVLYSKVPHEFFVENRLEGMALDHFIDVTATILKMNNPLHIDEHLRPQAWQYRPDDVDYIVPLESMSDFLESRFGIQPGPVHNKTRLPRISASEQQLERIREIYACDYAIKPNWPDSGTVQKKPPGIVDLRKLEAPEPMEKILMACARLGPEDNFQARLPHVPGPLFPHLEARGLDWKIHQERDGSTLITIWRRS